MLPDKLLLHEAIAVVLINCSGRVATFDEIADKINHRLLYQRKDKKILPAYQVKQRCFLGKGRYLYLFEKVGKDSVKLRNI